MASSSVLTNTEDSVHEPDACGRSTMFGTTVSLCFYPFLQENCKTIFGRQVRRPELMLKYFYRVEKSLKKILIKKIEIDRP